MAHYGSTSQARLDTCNANIQLVMQRAIGKLPWTDPVSSITINDATIIEGHRNKERQDYAFETHKSEKQWPDSRHNRLPSDAVDAAVYHPARPHIHWSDKDEMEAFSRLVLECAAEENVDMTWGGDWDDDGVRVDQDPDEGFFDGPHFRENV